MYSKLQLYHRHDPLGLQMTNAFMFQLITIMITTQGDSIDRKLLVLKL